MLDDVRPMLDPLVAHRLLDVSGAIAQPGHPVNHVHHQVVAIKVVPDDHVERRRGRALLFVAPHVEMRMALAAVGEPVD